MKPSKKKRRSRAPKSPNQNPNFPKDTIDRGMIDSLIEAFASASVDEVKAACVEANGDINKAAEILSDIDVSTSSSSCSEMFFTSSSDDPSTSSSSTSSDRFFDSDVGRMPVRRKGFGGNKGKRVIATAGTVSAVIGKDYVARSDFSKSKRGVDARGGGVGEAEQFLYSMLADGCALSLDVVRDVYCQCGYDVEKALSILLDLSSSSSDQFKADSFGESSKHDSGIFSRSNESVDVNCQIPNRMSVSTSDLSDNGFQQILQSSGYHYRDYREALLSTETRFSAWEATRESGLQPGLAQKVLESLFNVPKNSENQPNSMNWKNVAKKMESFGQGFNLHYPELQQNTEYAKGEEYRVLRKAAEQNWDRMKSCYQKAVTAYSKGEKEYASYLSEQGQIHSKVAQEADEKASREIFEARNREIENVVTIDLHGQHVKQAMRLMKVHLLLFTTYIPSVQYLRVITGCGSHGGAGQGKLKQSVRLIVDSFAFGFLRIIGLATQTGIEWSEENRGTIMMKLQGQLDFNFGDSEGESD
ncbi:hypothetical protein GIB67_027495 [Kingdonia uniflora]|uniref:Smr domain-containing protein n=1 Tax=Kingdonia uniflora TaxID=39325 RepID=A0A7J7MFX7_9MAGN|nr:hypothetical protein GIB67_027495 [Kingdonia uniflora]